MWERGYFLAKLEGKTSPISEHAKREYMCDLSEKVYTFTECSLHRRIFSVALCIIKVKKTHTRISCLSFWHCSGLNAVVKSNSDITWCTVRPCAHEGAGTLRYRLTRTGEHRLASLQQGCHWQVPVLITQIRGRTEVGADGWKGCHEVRRHDCLLDSPQGTFCSLSVQQSVKLSHMKNLFFWK